MAQRSNTDLFKMGVQFIYKVTYLGNGPVENIIPDYILKRRRKGSGELIFSLKGVEFEGFEKDDWFGTDPVEVRLNFSMDEIEDEKACQENKILSITLLPCDGNSEERRYYFDVSENGERGRAVYHPQWIHFAKRYNERLARDAL